MAQKCFVDTNILIYAHDRSAGAKHDRELIERLWASGEGVLSTQVLQELCINLRRKVARPLPIEEVDPGLSELGGHCKYTGVGPAGPRHRGAIQDFILGCAGVTSGGELGCLGSVFRGSGGWAALWCDSGSKSAGGIVIGTRRRMEDKGRHFKIDPIFWHALIVACGRELWRAYRAGGVLAPPGLLHLSLAVHPQLALWAAFFRRFAAGPFSRG